MKFLEYLNLETGEFSLNPAYQEILKFEKMVKDAGIPHTTRQLYDGFQVIYPNEEIWLADAIENFGSYGNQKDLLEVSGLLTKEEEAVDSVLGSLTAEEAFRRLKNLHDGKEVTA